MQCRLCRIFLRGERDHRAARDVDYCNVGRRPIVRARIRNVVEDDRSAVRRPVKSSDAAAVVGKPSRFTLAVRILLDRQNEQSGKFDVLIDPSKIVPAAVVLFLVLGFWIGHRICDPSTVRRPFEIAHGAFPVGDLLRLATRHPDNEDLIPVVLPVGRERDHRPIRRPFGIGRRPVAVGDLDVFFSVKRTQPYLSDKFALVGRHNGLVDGVNDTLAVRRDPRARERLDLDVHFGRPRHLGRGGCRKYGNNKDKSQNGPR